MKKAEIAILIVLGILSAISLSLPQEAFFYAYYFYIIPGLLLHISPTIFVYYALSIILRVLLSNLKIPFPNTLSLTCLLAAGCLISYILNLPIYKILEEYESLDANQLASYEINKSDVIAIHSNHYTKFYSDYCNPLCQKLLYNEAARKVLVVTDALNVKTDLKSSVTAYSIEKKENCSSDGAISKKAGGVAKNVYARIVAGECLVKSSSTFGSANKVFSHVKINHDEHYRNYSTSKRQKISGQYIELLERKNNKHEKVYRATDIEAAKYVYPFGFEIIFAWMKVASPMHFKQQNITGFSYGREIDELPAQIQNIFGNALREIDPPKQSIRDLTDLSSAGYELFGEYLFQLCRSSDLTEGDMKRIVNALKDERIDKWRSLICFQRKWHAIKGSLPTDYLRALTDRIALGYNIEEMARTISMLPDGTAKSIYPELSAIAKIPKINTRAARVLTRLSDSGKIALPQYIQILKKYHYYTLLLKSEYNKRNRRLAREYYDLSTFAMIGLCNLGTDALPAKDILFSLIDEKSPSSILNKSIVMALVSAGAVQDLVGTYQDSEEFMGLVRDVLRDKSYADKKGRKFCGKHIM